MKTRRTIYVMSLLALCGAVAASAQQVAVDAAMSQSIILAGEKQTAYLRVAMTGFEVEEADRTPVNVAIVLDKSGSMTGEKIEHAKEAAIMAIRRLRKDDIVSVVVYDTTVNVLVPATKLSNKESIANTIRSIKSGGNTALFAGVSRGANEVRKFLAKNRVNRVILLSDGLANVGPSAPSDLAELGDSLGREGISVTTIGLGLGYNEDLMTRRSSWRACSMPSSGTFWRSWRRMSKWPSISTKACDRCAGSGARSTSRDSARRRASTNSMPAR